MGKIIDYSKPIKSDLDEGNKAKKIIEIMQTKPSKYDAKHEAEKALKNLRKQGLQV